MGCNWTRRTDKKRVIGLALLLIHIPQVPRTGGFGASNTSPGLSVCDFERRKRVEYSQTSPGAHSTAQRGNENERNVRVGSKNGM
jgi:hypothetical protein